MGAGGLIVPDGLSFASESYGRRRRVELCLSVRRIFTYPLPSSLPCSAAHFTLTYPFLPPSLPPSPATLPVP